MGKIQEITAREKDHRMAVLAARAYASEEIPGIFLIAMRFDWGVGEPFSDVWAASSLTADQGRIWSVSTGPQLFAKWPEGPWPTSRTAPAIRAASECLAAVDESVDAGSVGSA